MGLPIQRFDHGIAPSWICPLNLDPSTRSLPDSSALTNRASSATGYVPSASAITTKSPLACAMPVRYALP